MIFQCHSSLDSWPVFTGRTISTSNFQRNAMFHIRNQWSSHCWWCLESDSAVKTSLYFCSTQCTVHTVHGAQIAVFLSNSQIVVAHVCIMFVLWCSWITPNLSLSWTLLTFCPLNFLRIHMVLFIGVCVLQWIVVKHSDDYWGYWIFVLSLVSEGQ